MDDNLAAKVFAAVCDFLGDASNGRIGNAKPENVCVESRASPCPAEDFARGEISGFQSGNK